MTTRWPFDEKPMLVFWETTKACLLTCKHCRAEAITEHLPDTLTKEEGFLFIGQLVEFTKPYPVLVLTGGDPLMRKDVFDLIAYAKRKELNVALAPSTTELLDEALKRIKELDVASVSVSLDGPEARVHDSIRDVSGTFEKTVKAIERLRDEGVKFQVNTAVMRENVEYLADLTALLVKMGVPIWEVFFLVPVGRAAKESDLLPEEWEDVSHFLYEASKSGILVRTAEGPMFRRVSTVRQILEERGIKPDDVLEVGWLYRKLKNRLTELLNGPRDKAKTQTSGTRDGKGIIFVAYNGDVYPSGFLTYVVGNVRKEPLAKVYKEKEVLKQLRAADFKGRCGRCEFRDLCGGSRARAYAYYSDLLAEDPACPYEPESYLPLFSKAGLNYEDLIFTSNKK